VRLDLEPHRPRDSFDRVLAHVELPDGTDLATALLEAGLARSEPRWPHAWSGRHEQIEVAARRRGAGIWSAE
jgi:endonuclease YncB( thermonuclease family)